MSDETKTIELGKQFTLKASVIPSNATNKKITWESLDEEVATVNNGVIKAVGLGTTRIYAYSNNGMCEYCSVTVKRDYLAEFNALSLDEKLLVYTIGKIQKECNKEFEIREMYSGTVSCNYQWSGSRGVYISYVPEGYSLKELMNAQS